MNPPSRCVPGKLRLADVDRIVLTGFMGSGKTTVGNLLAQSLGWRFLDLDREIERRDRRSVPAIFAADGEAHFRHLENQALAAALGEQHVVLALGGGAPEELGNRLLLEQTQRTLVIYLSAPLPTLLDRCERDAARPETVQRPLLTEATNRFQLRHPLYVRLSAYTIETTGVPPGEVVSALLKDLGADL